MKIGVAIWPIGDVSGTRTAEINLKSDFLCSEPNIIHDPQFTIHDFTIFCVFDFLHSSTIDDCLSLT